MPVFRAALLANSRNLGDFGLVVSEVDGWFGGSRLVTKTRIRNRAGSLITGVEDGEKTVTVTATVVGSSVATRNAQLDQIFATLTGLPIYLERADSSGRTGAQGVIEGAITATPVPPGQRSRAMRVAFRVTLDGYIQDVGALPYGFGATRVPMPLGTAPVAPLLRLRGAATNPVLRYRNLAGDILNEVTFTITLGANDWLEIDCSTYRIEKVVAGTRSDAISTYAGNTANLPVLDPDDGRQVDGAYPTLEVSAGSGLALYPRMWR